MLNQKIGLVIRHDIAIFIFSVAFLADADAILDQNWNYH